MPTSTTSWSARCSTSSGERLAKSASPGTAIPPAYVYDGMDLANGADQPGPNPLHGPADIVARVALIPHLCCQAGVPGHLGEAAGVALAEGKPYARWLRITDDPEELVEVLEAYAAR